MSTDHHFDPRFDRPGRHQPWNDEVTDDGPATDGRLPGPAVPTEESGSRNGPSTEAAPFGLPVLAEIPQLAALLEGLTVADRRSLMAVARLADLLRGDTVETVTGVGVEHWLAAVAAMTRMDRRLLTRACRLLHRLPTLDDAVRTGRISFAQLRGITLTLRTVSRHLDGQVDQVLSGLLDGLDTLERPDPDMLVGHLTDALDEIDPDDLAQREQDAAANRFLSLQPRLDGTGGRFVGDLDAPGLALLDAATAPTLEHVAEAGGHGPARADLLLARLAGAGPGATDTDSDATGDGVDGDASDAAATCADDVETHGADTAGPGRSWRDQLTPPRLLLRLPFDALVDDTVPGELLTRMVGGRLKLTSAAARRLVDERGSQLRTVIVDDHGTVIGVGRTTRQPPGWLTDATLAIHDTCTSPGCRRPARACQVDHATPWWPARPDSPFGTTDVDNLGPLCAGTNRAKEAAGWTTIQTAAGTRTWRHTRSGLTTTTVPSTWRAPGDPRYRHRRRPPSTDPPEHDRSGPVEPGRGPKPVGSHPSAVDPLRAEDSRRNGPADPDPF